MPGTMDRRGNKLQQGDVVSLNCIVEEIHENGWMTVRTETALPGAARGTILTVNGAQCQRNYEEAAASGRR